jgi:hypothetical protein
MIRTYTRDDLYNLVWSKPLGRLAADLGIEPGPFSALLRRARIPTPPPGYRMKKEFGKPVVQPAPPPAPEYLSDPTDLTVATSPRTATDDKGCAWQARIYPALSSSFDGV